LPVDSKPIVYPTNVDIARKAKRPTTTSGGAITNGHTNGFSSVTGKRKRATGDMISGDEQPQKKGKLAAENDSLIVLDDTGNGAIEIEDD
jgi:hypothetical protein